MIELYIDGELAILPEDFEQTFTEENTLITKGGEYSFDIELSLLNPVNARIYKHINRQNSVATFAARNITLIVEGKIYVRGVESILGWTQKSVKIQILSGNSAVNLASSGVKVRDLDFGNIPAYNEYQAIQSLSKFYPETPVIFPPIMSGNDVIINEFRYYLNFDNGSKSGEYPPQLYRIPQIYLLFYIEKVCEVMGYTIESNCLRNDPIANRIYFPNTFIPKDRTYWKYNECFPTKWTVDEFLTEIEKFFGVAFVFDKSKKATRILPIKTNPFGKTTIKRATDIFECTPENSGDSNTSINVNCDGVKYELPSSTYYNYLRLIHSDLVYGGASFAGFENLAAAISFAQSGIGGDGMNLYEIGDTGNRFIYSGGNMKMVDIFEEVNPSNNNVLSLKIYPAEIATIQARFRIHSSGSSNDSYAGNYNIMKTESVVFEYETQTLSEIIEDGVKKIPEPGDDLPIAIYFGLDHHRNPDGTPSDNSPVFWPTSQLHPEFPWSVNDCYFNFYNVDKIHYPKKLEEAKQFVETLPPGNTLWGYLRAYIQAEEPIYKALSLRLKGTTGIYSRQNTTTKVDTLKKFKSELVIDEEIDPRAEFIINNKSYTCEKIEYKLTKNGKSKIATGYFYPNL